MSKKAGRSARALQAEAQRMGIKARPLVDIEKSSLANPSRTTVDELEAAESVAQSSPQAATGSVTLPRRVYARRTSTLQPTKDNTAAREEEYAFIRADLRTVFILTILMVVILVALTFVVK